MQEFEEFADSLNWDSPNNLVINGVKLLPTVIQDTNNTVLGVVFSSRESLKCAMKDRIGVYHSRKRGEIWVKSSTRVNGQTLLSVSFDCDRDALLFRVIQRGVFCHTGSMSCFTKEIELQPSVEKIIIGYTYGRSETETFQLLGSVGIDIFKSTKPRNAEYKVFSHLHNNISIVGCKPRDINKLLEEKTIDVAVCFSDVITHDNVKSFYPKNSKTVKIVSAIRSDDRRFDNTDYHDMPLKIFTEYDEIGKIYVSENFSKSKLVNIHGNTEQFIRDNMGDIGIVVCDSGKTLKENGLKILDVIETPRLGFFTSMESYAKNPRFFRELANNLDNDTVFFYSVDGENGFMSNFYPCRFIDDIGREWRSSEHYYQAHKFHDVLLFELIRSQPTAKLCYKTAYKYQEKFRNDWLEVKDKYMMEALQYKFSQNPELMTALLKTGSKLLVEHALKDYHYGCGADGSGKNMLGIMLMKIRTDNAFTC